MHAPKRGSKELERQREWHGYSFRGYTAEQNKAIAHYIRTGERLENLPKGENHDSSSVSAPGAA